jgi:hypothetical protein
VAQPRNARFILVGTDQSPDSTSSSSVRSAGRPTRLAIQPWLVVASDGGVPTSTVRAPASAPTRGRVRYRQLRWHPRVRRLRRSACAHTARVVRVMIAPPSCANWHQQALATLRRGLVRGSLVRQKRVRRCGTLCLRPPCNACRTSLREPRCHTRCGAGAGIDNPTPPGTSQWDQQRCSGGSHGSRAGSMPVLVL